MALYKDAIWFNGSNGCIGFILCTHEQGDDHGVEGDPCAYIGIAPGQDEEKDIEYIMNYGTYFGGIHLQNIMEHFGVAE